MISTAKLNAVTDIIVHDNCPDGLASAILLHDALPDAKIQFVQYGSDAHRKLTPRPGLLFADFSPYVPEKEIVVDGKPTKAPDYKVLYDFRDAGTIVLDHHKTAKEIVEKHEDNGVFGDEKTEPGVCGAVLAYRHVWKPLREELSTHSPNTHGLGVFAQEFARLAGIRDTWQRQSPDWAKACKQAEVLLFMPRERWLSKSFGRIAHEWESNEWIGDVLLERQAKHVTKTIDGGHHFWTSKGTHAIMFGSPSATSDAAESLGEEVDLVIGFSYFEETLDDKRVQKMVISTRSHKKYDCSKLAKHYGGGGHTAAAGFNLFVQAGDFNPYTHVPMLVERYEKAKT